MRYQSFHAPKVFQHKTFGVGRRFMKQQRQIKTRTTGARNSLGTSLNDYAPQIDNTLKTFNQQTHNNKMTNYLIIPGLGNSGPDHWQTYFQHSGDHFFRVEQQEWDAPDCEAWVTTLDKKVLDFDLSSVVLVGHSLGCSTIAHWAKKYKRQIKGALLVAPSDPEADQYTFPATGFAPIPLDIINFKTIVVASEDDIWVSLERAKFFADHWGSAFINLGNAGHINVASGHTHWDEGMHILKTIG